MINVIVSVVDLSNRWNDCITTPAERRRGDALGCDGSGGSAGPFGYRRPLEESTTWRTSNSSRQAPEPSTTDCNGLSAVTIGMPVSLASR